MSRKRDIERALSSTTSPSMSEHAEQAAAFAYDLGRLAEMRRIYLWWKHFSPDFVVELNVMIDRLAAKLRATQ